MEVILYPDAEQAIRDETLRFRNEECAGLLLGHSKENGTQIHVVRSSASGPQAEHGAAYIRPDTDFFNEIIEDAEKEGLTFLGEWHKHPGWISEPSNGDIRTIQEIMATNAMQRYLAVIVNGAGPMASLKSFIFRNKTTYDEIPCRVLHTGLSDLGPMDEPLDSSLHTSDLQPNEGFGQFLAQEPTAHEPSDPVIATQDNPKPPGFLSRVARAFSLRGSSEAGLEGGGSLGASSSVRWYENPELRNRLLLERESMRNHFPDFSLHEKDGCLFWKSVYRDHHILLKYPRSFPHGPIEVIVVPDIVPLTDEHPNHYAVVAAEYAVTRIDYKMLEEDHGAAHALTESAGRGQQWYETEEGKKRFTKEMTDLTGAGYDIRRFRTSAGMIAIQVSLRNNLRVILVCPENYPNAPPRIQLPSECVPCGIEKPVDAFYPLSTRWWNPSTDSLVYVIREVVSRIESHSGSSFADESSGLP